MYNFGFHKNIFFFIIAPHWSCTNVLQDPGKESSPVAKFLVPDWGTKPTLA
jgi:hypothetical protein